MTIEEEVRAFAQKYIPNGEEYLRSQRVPPFKGTWADVFAGRIAVDERVQRYVLRDLREIWGNREPRGWTAL
jgi:hypothetical protein